MAINFSFFIFQFNYFSVIVFNVINITSSFFKPNFSNKYFQKNVLNVLIIF